jgi:hypothetical protein
MKHALAIAALAWSAVAQAADFAMAPDPTLTRARSAQPTLGNSARTARANSVSLVARH